MAQRPRGYGMTAELKDKMNSKYDPEMEKQALDWIGSVLSEPISASGQGEVKEALKDGVILCKLMNTLVPGSVKKINDSKMAFKQMENIGKFLDAAVAYGCSKMDMFQTVDLYEGGNMVQVISGIHALGRQAQKKGFHGPTLGPKESEANRREFTEEQLRAGEGVIGLQAGTNKGASQAGQNFGKSRSIVD